MENGSEHEQGRTYEWRVYTFTGFFRNANINDPDVYQKAAQNLEGFWGELAHDITGSGNGIST